MYPTEFLFAFEMFTVDLNEVYLQFLTPFAWL
jgi:hypothetical protein